MSDVYPLCDHWPVTNHTAIIRCENKYLNPPRRRVNNVSDDWIPENSPAMISETGDRPEQGDPPAVLSLVAAERLAARQQA